MFDYCWTSYLPSTLTQDAGTTVTQPGGISALLGVNNFKIYAIEIWGYLFVFTISIIIVSIFILEVAILSC